VVRIGLIGIRVRRAVVTAVGDLVLILVVTDARRVYRRGVQRRVDDDDGPVRDRAIAGGIDPVQAVAGRARQQRGGEDSVGTKATGGRQTLSLEHTSRRGSRARAKRRGQLRVRGRAQPADLAARAVLGHRAIDTRLDEQAIPAQEPRARRAVGDAAFALRREHLDRAVGAAQRHAELHDRGLLAPPLAEPVLVLGVELEAQALAVGCAATLSRALCSGSGALVANPAVSASTTTSTPGNSDLISASLRSFPSMNTSTLPPYSITTRSEAPRPNVSGMYISSALGGGTTKSPGVVARPT